MQLSQYSDPQYVIIDCRYCVPYTVRVHTVYTVCTLYSTVYRVTPSPGLVSAEAQVGPGLLRDSYTGRTGQGRPARRDGPVRANPALKTSTHTASDGGGEWGGGGGEREERGLAV